MWVCLGVWTVSNYFWSCAVWSFILSCSGILNSWLWMGSMLGLPLAHALATLILRRFSRIWMVSGMCHHASFEATVNYGLSKPLTLAGDGIFPFVNVNSFRVSL